MSDGIGRDALKRVLFAYARHNPSVGYCQGMNFLTALLLLLMEEEAAFWCLAAIVEDILPGYFTNTMLAGANPFTTPRLLKPRHSSVCRSY